MAPRQPLTRERILDAALALASTDGLDGLSMRKLAKSLGVEAMALYNHVANKTEILDGIADRVLGGIDRADPELPWAQRVRATAVSMYRALRHHPVVPMALATDQANPTSLRALQPIDDLLGAFYEAGLDDDGVRQALGAVQSLVHGSILLSTTGFVRDTSRTTPGEQLDPYVHRLDPDKLPHFSRVQPVLSAGDAESDFVRGLDVLIAGLPVLK
ncbi:TetR/AcrR family transcriptional regulator C-terminal domain-containing protein [Saccharopolyspora sp. K220]|uniref:TetR/AcrR family transcriptional regulator n=1 Tax=Saccharopolyspora soli TaxID=2926618 RepID=UPI001F57A61F|nr:TetR/AcrR family transcriptional regulator C-terminal domain-containing protein [Saccharopolyspora soli]MCI2417192.1 TetR/AcrR family transcriptional regulator C-terminal domain-containing protein [Saccharopolyspora soli]